VKATIATLPGDGVGQEILPAAINVLEAIAKRFGHSFEFVPAIVGGAAIDATGQPLPEETLNIAKCCDSVLLGAVGGPKWEGLDYSIRPERALLGLRKELGMYGNLRPAKLFPMLADASTIKLEVLKDLDLLVVRELTGGIYFGEPRGIQTTETGKRGINTEVYTTEEIVRVARIAFEAAQKRNQHVTSVDKANVLESSELWRSVIIEVHKDYSDVRLDHMYVDNCAMQLIRNPRQFDVIVTTNLFGDILSDEAAMLTGSIGMLPSASLGDKHAMYEPVHGSAPDIAGRDIANPIAMIASSVMMLTHSFHLDAEAQAIDAGIYKALEQGYRTKDLESPSCITVGTKEMSGHIVAAILTS
tara:strand:+ start:450 stop:1526 length:1077 start_codon:yes stop_codon:yes gene_type:complete